MKLKLLLILFLLISSNLFADEVSMGFGIFPPYIFPQSQSGIEIEIMREALAFRGHTLKPILLPMARLSVAYQAKDVNSIMSDVGKKISPNDGYYGNTAVIFQNVFITLKKRNLSKSLKT